MTKRKKILLTVAGSIAGVLIVLLIAAIVTIQTPWFANFVRHKIIATAEESTGGTVEIGAFEFDLGHFTVRIRDFVLHGTEPQGSDPLLRVKLLELHLKLFAGLKKALDLEYLGIEQPRANLMLLPDGKTNIPQPKVPSKPSQTSGLQTVVDLAVNRFRLNDGLLEVLQQKMALSARGENLRVLLDYNALKPGYAGSVVIDPLVIASGGKSPLNVHVNLPVALESDAVRIAGATLSTARSQVGLNASVQNMNAPVIQARLNARVSLAEMQKSFDLPIDSAAKGAPQELTAELGATLNGKTNAIQIRTAHLGLGRTTFQASGDLNPITHGAAQFNANFALAELSRLLKISSVEARGDLQANGKATLDAQNNYYVDGALASRGLSVRSGTTEVSDLSLSSPFHADPFLISMDGLKLQALGGLLAAKIFVEKMQNLSVEGHLRNFSIPVLVATLTGKHFGYDGALDGSLLAKGNLQAKGTTGYTGNANLEIIPGRHGIPVSGRLNAKYQGLSGALDLAQSYLALPNSRLDLTGTLNKEIDLKLVSQNLNDFLPAANFGAAKPQTSLPVVLQGGTALVNATITGSTANPKIGAHLEVTDFAVEQRPFNRVALDLSASSSAADVRNGVLTGKGLDTGFGASIGLVKWSPEPRSPLAANLTLRNGDLTDLMSLSGDPSLQGSGAVTADVHINGTYGDPLGGAHLQVTDGSFDQQPFSNLLLNVNLADQLITLSQLELDTAGGRITSSGTFRHPKQSFTVGHAQAQLAIEGVQLANVQALSKQNAGVAGAVRLAANLTADVADKNNKTSVTLSNATADLSASNLQVQHQSAGSLTAKIRTTNGKLDYSLNSDFAGSNVKVNGETALTGDYVTTADASIHDLSVAKALQLAGQSAIPASGQFSAEAHARGTLDDPVADLDFALAKASVYGELVNGLNGRIHYANNLVDIPSIALDAPAGTVTLKGSYNHPTNDYTGGALNLNLASSDIQMDKIEHVEAQKPGLGGTLKLAANLSARLRDEHGKSQLLVSNLNADASASGMHLNNMALGGMNFSAHTAGSTLNFRLDSDLAKAQIHGSGQAQLTGDYPVRGSLSFNNIKYSNLAPFIASQPSVAPPPFEASVGGKISVNGPLLNTDSLAAQLRLDQLDVRTSAANSPTGTPALRTVDLQNQGAIVLTLDHDVVQIKQLNVGARNTSLKGSGSVNLKNAADPLSLTLEANVDLGLLQDADKDFYSSGSISLNTSVRGTFSQPRANGQIVLKNANVNYAGAPNGLSNANGVIALNGTNASIQNLTAESGGGKVALTGFAGLGSGVPSFNLKAAASSVRVRYSGISATSNATITLTGNLKRSFLGGTISIERIAYASTSDAGSLLSTASAPPSTPASPSPLLSGMRLDVHVLTAPDIQVVSTYANRLSVLANLTVRGTAENPGMLGHVIVTDGQLVFFGNTYTVTTGTINFYDPTSITPVLNISLDTITQGVNVTLGVSGPMNNLKLSYRSDPPLSFEQIVQLLATNTTPANPVIAAHQPAPPQQSLSQMGESAVLGQAVANPLASRVQRVFGLSQFKIDPSFTGAGGQPSARVTLQEKVASNITFTYITDVNQANAQIVRVQWDLTNNLSAVGLRDFNGNVSVEVFYKFTRR